jgi:gluconolactonase
MKATIEFSLLFLSLLFVISCKKEDNSSTENSKPIIIASNLQFAEGPAYYNGILYFSDIQANKIYKWNKTSGLQVFKANSGGANGLYFDNSGNLIVCEGSNKRVTSINPNLAVTILADKFENKQFNEPNDLWISPTGNIYFTDPVFTGTLTQSGENVYCILSSNKQIIKVAGDLVKPNGIIGNADGTKLYIADYGASIIYQYSISSDGTLTNKQIFANVLTDGLTIDNEGNIYAASQAIMKYNSVGGLIKSTEISGIITNLCFVETENILFVTTHNEVYQINF